MRSGELQASNSGDGFPPSPPSTCSLHRIYIEPLCRGILVILAPPLWASLQIHRCLSRRFPRSMLLRSDPSMKLSKSLVLRMAYRVERFLKKFETTLWIRRSPIGLLASAKIVFLLDPRSFYALPDWREVRGGGLQLVLAQLIVRALLPGRRTYEQQLAESFEALREREPRPPLTDRIREGNLAWLFQSERPR